MDNNEKMFELMTKMYSEMQKGFKNVNEKINGVENELKDFRKETNDRFDKLENKLDDVEANNGDRHIEINGKVENMKSDISRIEMNTADNWKDIARLKSIK